MKIQLLSDLHNEFLRHGEKAIGHLWTGVIPDTDADIIVLAGDIDTGVLGVDWAISESKRLAKKILYVLGNHEFYGYEYFGLKAEIQQRCAGTEVYLLDSDVFIEGEVRFIGATLWTDYLAYAAASQENSMLFAGNRLADHRHILVKTGDSLERFQPSHALRFHQQELIWLEQQLAVAHQGPIVVVTHHGPDQVCQHSKFPLSEMSAAFHSDLSRTLEKFPIEIWAFGHTHSNVDTVVSNTRIVSNQAGYPGENVCGFDPNFLLEV